MHVKGESAGQRRAVALLTEEEVVPENVKTLSKTCLDCDKVSVSTDAICHSNDASSRKPKSIRSIKHVMGSRHDRQMSVRVLAAHRHKVAQVHKSPNNSLGSRT